MEFIHFLGFDSKNEGPFKKSGLLRKARPEGALRQLAAAFTNVIINMVLSKAVASAAHQSGAHSKGFAGDIN